MANLFRVLPLSRLIPPLPAMRDVGDVSLFEIGARAYKECSALKIEGVDDVFEAATRASMLMREGAPSGSAGYRYGEQATGETGWGWKCRVSMPHMHVHVHGPRPLCHVCDVSLFAHCIFFLFLLYALLCVCFM